MAEEETVVTDETVEAPVVESVPDTEAPVDTTVTGGEKAQTLAEAIESGLAAQAAKEPTDKPAGEVDGKVSKPATDEKEEQADKDADKKEDAEKKPDHVNDPIPAQVSERTRERITSLVSTVKEQEGYLKNQGDLIQTIQDTGATAEQFSYMIGFLRDFNAPDMESVERAYATIQQMLPALSIRLGREIPEVDMLKDYPELAEQVKYGQISKAAASELAIARIRSKIGGESAARTREQANTQQKFETDKASAIKTLNDLGKALAVRDGAVYDAKFKEIIPALQAEFAKIPPSQWEATFHRAYNMSVAKPAPVAVVAPIAKKPQPIRPVTPAGGGGGAAVAAPKSLADAISAGIDAAAG